MKDKTPLPQDTIKDGYIIVHTAKQPPSWLPWVTYAIIAVNTYLGGVETNYYVAVVGGIALLMTHMFYATYRALTVLYNEVKVSAAVRHFSQSALPMGTTTDQVEKPEEASKTLSRYWDALTWINTKCSKLGDARDAAWRALDHDDITAKAKEHADGDEQVDSEEATKDTGSEK